MNSAIWKFVSPTQIIFGWGGVPEAGSWAEKSGYKTALLVTDKGVVESGILNKVLEPLKQYGIKTVIFDETKPEPQVEQIGLCFECLIKTKCDFIMGVGGGSSMDLAKAVGLVAGNEGNFEDYVGIGKVAKKGLPTVLIPTTSGTGSEVSKFSVMTAGDSKRVVVDPLICADIAIVDPDMTMTVPRRVTAYTGIDALCHHIETFLSVLASPMSDTIAQEGMKCILQHIRTAVADGENKKARYYMSYGSMLGGYSMNLTDGAGANHGLAFALGTKYHLPHGLANAVMLPYSIEAIASASYDKIRVIGNLLELDLKGLTGKAQTAKVVEAFKELLTDVGLPFTLREIGAKKTDLEELTNEAMSQTRVMNHSLYKLTRDEVLAVFENAY